MNGLIKNSGKLFKKNKFHSMRESIAIIFLVLVPIKGSVII